MKTFREVIDRWPSAAALARDLGLQYNTVAGWVRRDSIPAESWAAVIAAAKARNLEGVDAEALVQLAAANREQPSVAA